jgi:hypothetical protein
MLHFDKQILHKSIRWLYVDEKNQSISWIGNSSEYEKWSSKSLFQLDTKSLVVSCPEVTDSDPNREWILVSARWFTSRVFLLLGNQKFCTIRKVYVTAHGLHAVCSSAAYIITMQRVFNKALTWGAVSNIRSTWACHCTKKRQSRKLFLLDRFVDATLGVSLPIVKMRFRDPHPLLDQVIE